VSARTHATSICARVSCNTPTHLLSPLPVGPADHLRTHGDRRGWLYGASGRRRSRLHETSGRGMRLLRRPRLRRGILVKSGRPRGRPRRRDGNAGRHMLFGVLDEGLKLLHDRQAQGSPRDSQACCRVLHADPGEAATGDPQSSGEHRKVGNLLTY